MRLRPFPLILQKQDIDSTEGQDRQMDSLERKLERLSPEQRREVEDFADFLLQHRKAAPSPAANPVPAPPPPTHQPPPPPPVQEPSPAAEPVRVYDLIRGGDTEPAAPQEDPVTLLLQEIAVDDSFAADYMDYGSYEQPPPSPATEAVQRVKEKLNQKKKNEPAKKMLDWID
jgi:hypothetical protein